LKNREDDLTLEEELYDVIMRRATEMYVNEECKKLMEECEAEEFEPSKKHKRKMKKLINSIGKEEHSLSFTLQKVAVFAVAFAFCGGLALQVEAVRNGIANFYYDVTEQSMDISPSSDSISIPDGWDYVYTLGYIPEGYSLYDSGMKSTDSFFTTYKNEDKNKIIIRQSKSDDSKWSVDAEKMISERVDINGKEAYLMDKGSYSIAWWYNGDYYINIIADTNNKEILKISKNLVKKSK